MRYDGYPAVRFPRIGLGSGFLVLRGLYAVDPISGAGGKRRLMADEDLLKMPGFTHTL